MINISKIADSLEKNEITDDTLKLNKLIQTLYFSPFVKLGEIRDVFEATTKEDLLKLFNSIKELDPSQEDEDGKLLGESVTSNIFRNIYWNEKSSNYYWKKLKNKKKLFI